MLSRLIATLFIVLGMFWSVLLRAEDTPKPVDAPAVELKIANRSIMAVSYTHLTLPTICSV